MRLKKLYLYLGLVVVFSTTATHAPKAGFLDALRGAAGTVAHATLHSVGSVAAYTAGSALMHIGSSLGGGYGGYGMGYQRPWGQGGNMLPATMPPMGGMGMMGPGSAYGGGYGGGGYGGGGYGGGYGGRR